MRGRPGHAVLLLILVLVATGPAAAAPPEGQLTWAVQFALAPTWFDPAETTGILTPFFSLYAIHDALVKPMLGNPMGPSLAESWSVSADGPTLALNGPDDADSGTGARGRWIPTIAVDQYAATLAQWFGVSSGDLPMVLPNIGRFSTPDLGFMLA